MRIVNVTATLALLLVGCATYKTSDKLEAASAAIRAAEEAGADKVPAAKYHLDRAKEETQYAKEQLSYGNKRGASSTLDRTIADTDLAVQLVREERSHEATNKLGGRIHQVVPKTGGER
jgi:hypothetical protein